MTTANIITSSAPLRDQSPLVMEQVRKKLEILWQEASSDPAKQAINLAWEQIQTMQKATSNEIHKAQAIIQVMNTMLIETRQQRDDAIDALATTLQPSEYKAREMVAASIGNEIEMEPEIVMALLDGLSGDSEVWIGESTIYLGDYSLMDLRDALRNAAEDLMPEPEDEEED